MTAIKIERTPVTLAVAKQLISLIVGEGPMRRSIFLRGTRGIGKSSAFRQVAEENNYGLVWVDTPSQIAEQGDVPGLPEKSGDRTIYLPPHWYVEAQELAKKYKRVIINFDDMGRATPQVNQALMPVFLDGKVGAFQFDPNVITCATGNPATAAQDYNVIEMDAAQTERVAVIEVKYHHETWLKWAIHQTMVEEWFAFLRDGHPELMEDESISPRTAMFANQALRNLKVRGIDFETELGMLRLDCETGDQIRQMFVSHLRTQGQIIKPEDILKKSYKKRDFERIMDEKRADLLHITYSRLAVAVANKEKLAQQEVLNIRDFIEQVPSDEINYVFLKMLPKDKEFIILDTALKDRLKERIHRRD